MILRCNYEELSALRAGARAYLELEPGAESPPVAAPPEERVIVESVAVRLSGDIPIRTLDELETLIRGVEVIVARLRVEMELMVAVTHPAAEGAVAAYFDFAHSFAVLNRLSEMDDEMRALVELMNGRPLTDEDVQNFVFPD